MQIVILDGHTTNPGDLSWETIQEYGNVTIYPNTNQNDIVNRSLSAQILIVNKIKITAEIINQLPQLKCICLLATGYNNIDLEACTKNQIRVFNAQGYSTDSVAQQVFAGLLHVIHRIDLHNQSVQKKEWANQPYFSYQLTELSELRNKNLGIYGFGQIGQAVGQLGLAFGMKVIAYHKHPKRDHKDWVTFVQVEELLKTSDVLSLHAPLNKQSQHFINEASLQMMKPSAILINTARGGLVHEEDLCNALKNNGIGAAYLDVLSQEPPSVAHPLYNLGNCIITPHHAWACKEARIRLVEIVANNIANFTKGNYEASLS